MPYFYDGRPNIDGRTVDVLWVESSDSYEEVISMLENDEFRAESQTVAGASQKYWFNFGTGPELISILDLKLRLSARS